MTNIILNIENEKFIAKLHEDKAPKTVKAFLQLLPYQSKVIHARYSGEAIWIPLPADLPLSVTLENQTSYPSKGELLYYPGFISEKELLIPYGATIFSSRVGQLPGNHFASIVDGHEKLAKVGNKVLWEGAKNITISKGPD